MAVNCVLIFSAVPLFDCFKDRDDHTTEWQNKALDAEPPVASFLTSMLIGGGPVNADVPPFRNRLKLTALLEAKSIENRNTDDLIGVGSVFERSNGTPASRSLRL